MTAKTILKHTLYIAKKDLTELFRNRLGLVLLIVMPLFMMVMIGFIYPSNSGAPTDLPIAFVNEDAGYNGSTLPSQTFYSVLMTINNKTNMMTLSNVTSESAVTDLIQRGEINGAIILPSNFSECLLNGEQASISIVTDESNPQMSATIRVALTTVINEMGTIMAQQTMIYTHPTLNGTQALAMVQPYTVPTPESSNYFNFIAPGIMALTVMMSVMTGLPVAISQEKEIGTMDGMIDRKSVV
jgi:ABC-2 type transport system permease protein